MCETAPQSASRVTLDHERDALGRMKVGARREEVLGILSPNAHHHMGTTRMHDDPKLGVADRNCKVHGLEDLYVAGSSVFQTSGAANPTFTIVALTLRLAEHLVSRLGVAK